MGEGHQVGADAGPEDRLGLDQAVGIELGALSQFHHDPEGAARAERHPQQRPDLDVLAGRKAVVEGAAHRARPGEGLHAGDHGRPTVVRRGVGATSVVNRATTDAPVNL